VEVARHLFGRYGYGATSIEQIAREASVAVPTVYAMYHSKRGLLFALLDRADAYADVAGLRRDLQAAAGDARKQLRRLVSFTCRFYTQAADIIDIARGAGSTNEDLLALWREGEERRLRAQAPLADAWRRAGALRKGLSARAAAQTRRSIYFGPRLARITTAFSSWSATGPPTALRPGWERRWNGFCFDEGLKRSLVPRTGVIRALYGNLTAA
jgi:AcrR family transcriptional regulator